MYRSTLMVCLLVGIVGLVNAKPTIYKVNENDNLEPVLVPVSSTVIPLAVYQVEFAVGVSGGKSGKPDKPIKPEEPIKLITASKKKINESTSIKEISKDEYSMQT